MRSRKKMTKEQRKLVKRMYAEGAKMESIVMAVDKTRVSIQRFLKKAGVPRRMAGYHGRRWANDHHAHG